MFQIRASQGCKELIYITNLYYLADTDLHFQNNDTIEIETNALNHFHVH